MERRHVEEEEEERRGDDRWWSNSGTGAMQCSLHGLAALVLVLGSRTEQVELACEQVGHELGHRMWDGLEPELQHDIDGYLHTHNT